MRPGCGVQNRGGKLGDRPDEVLTGVEHEQHLAGRQRLGDRRHRIVARLDRHAGGGGNRGGDEGRVVDRAEVDVADLSPAAGGDLDRQSRLARPRRAGERHRPVPFEELLEPDDVFVPADQGRDGDRDTA